MTGWLALGAAFLLALWVVPSVTARLRLTRAKHRSLHGHPRLARRLATLIPRLEYDDVRFFRCDDAPADVVAQRRAGLTRLVCALRRGGSRTEDATEQATAVLPDLDFTMHYRVPFQFSRYVRSRLPAVAFARQTDGVQIIDLDGRHSYDLSGSYGVNVFGSDFYKACIDAGMARVRQLGPILGPYHPIVTANVERLRHISGLDAVSFHMSGTEAVMQAVRLARYHTGRSHIVRFAGAYHGWWDDVQPGVGNPARPGAVYTLKDMAETTLEVLRTRTDIACVLVNPIQALHPNAGPPSDGTLVAGERRAAFDREGYTSWLRELRVVCTNRAIVLILDDVFTGFRLAYGGAQEYFGVRADLVTYGKTLGGGLPVGVVCGRADLMRRYRDDRPSDVCFARGTFNTHPYVMGAMHEFLHRLDEKGPEGRLSLRDGYGEERERWNGRFARLNERLAGASLPVRLVHLVSIATVLYTIPGRYHWLFQFYLRSHGLSLSWIGTGRLIFSHDYTDADFAAVADRFVAAAKDMRDAGWWWHPEAATTRSLRRQVMKELLRTALVSGAVPVLTPPIGTLARRRRGGTAAAARGDTA